MAATTIGVGSILPLGKIYISFPNQILLEVVDKMIGHKVWIIMTGNKEYFGFLRGFDEYLNVVLDDVKIYDDTGSGGRRILET